LNTEALLPLAELHFF